jgi:exonuclease SbcC
VALQGAQHAFEETCLAADFVSEADYLTACLDDAVLQELVVRAEALEQRGVALKERQGDRMSRLEEQRAKAVSTESMADLRARLATLDAERQAIGDELGLCKHTLEANDRALAGYAAKQQAIAAQQQLYRRWDNLHVLIGSADGKKFRNFAQGLTFDVVIAHANRQLRKMSDRYLLIRDVEQNLELNVIDAYQVGMVRSTKNLSGGEGFLVSLALALGLSQMSSQMIRVESLFLDEGFGTLDEEALDTALNTLASLQQSGKVIGVISHVASLKERIGTQIVVTPQTGGKSHLAGPGCQKVIR